MPPCQNFHSTWNKTTEYLLEARSHLSEAAEGVCANEIADFEEFLRNNELELALDAIDAAFHKGDDVNWRVLEYMAKAALCMGMVDRQMRYDEQLTQARGWRYSTSLQQ
ncbi:hypothetical protein [Paraburkholderia flava]|uniref:hypothetical protein n=1 Tax=Paraburkholderia flava TaxID=2547393 RepID=UPI001060BF24|nr:hypothetical protein [Paraburkholderia flava]